MGGGRATARSSRESFGITIMLPVRLMGVMISVRDRKYVGGEEF
jgi:hypothetical protein